jgi:hypothetical protein
MHSQAIPVQPEPGENASGAAGIRGSPATPESPEYAFEARHAGGRGFKSRPPRRNSEVSKVRMKASTPLVLQMHR